MCILQYILESLTESSSSIKSRLPKFESYVVEELTVQCAVHLKQVNDIPRLYRRTNKDVSNCSFSEVWNGPSIYI